MNAAKRNEIVKWLSNTSAAAGLALVTLSLIDPMITDRSDVNIEVALSGFIFIVSSLANLFIARRFGWDLS